MPGDRFPVVRSIARDIERLGSRHGDFVLTRELREHGWSEPSIRKGVAGLTKLVRGAFAITVPSDERARHRQLCVAVAATHPGLCVSYLSAATVWDLPMLGAPPLDAQVVPIGTSPHGWRAPSGIRHRGQPIDPRYVRWVDGIPVTDVTRTVVDCARVVEHDEALVIADAAVHRGQTNTHRILGVIATMTGWKGIEDARRMLAAVDGRSESPGETLSRLRAQQVGHPVTPQVEIWRDGRLVARVDLLVKGEFVVIEFDGQLKYNGDAPATFMAEKRRHDDLVMCGYEVVRLTWSDLTDPDRVRRLLDAAVSRARLRHPT